MDKKKSVLNVSISVGCKLVTMIATIVTMRFLIRICGNDVNGLNALYKSIIGFLAVAELGIGSAITFCMYKPIVDGNDGQVAALYGLFKKCYWSIGAIIFALGIALMPFLPYFSRDYAQLEVNVYLTFFLMLVSIVVSYMFSAESSLINAYKNNYITTSINAGATVLQCALQIIALLLTRSFVVYLSCRIISVSAQWIVTEAVARKKHGAVMNIKQELESEIKQGVVKSIKAMFVHKIGTFLVNTADSIIISAFIGVAALGYYTNYTMILSAADGILALIFTSLTSIIGHLFVKETADTTKRYNEMLHGVNFLIGIVFYLGYYAIIDNLIAGFFGASLVVGKQISFVITLNGFVQFMRRSVLVFREATGTFYYDRWKPLCEGTLNIVLSILFVKWIGVVGVIVATIITNLTICHIVEPYVLYRHAFNRSPKRYYLRNYSMITLFSLALCVVHFCLLEFENLWIELLVNGFISVGVSAAVCALLLLFNKELRAFVLNNFNKVRSTIRAKMGRNAS